VRCRVQDKKYTYSSLPKSPMRSAFAIHGFQTTVSINSFTVGADDTTFRTLMATCADHQQGEKTPATICQSTLVQRTCRESLRSARIVGATLWKIRSTSSAMICVCGASTLRNGSSGVILSWMVRAVSFCPSAFCGAAMCTATLVESGTL